MAPDPTFVFAGDPCSLTLDFVFAFWIMITLNILLTLQFCILTHLVAFFDTQGNAVDLFLPVFSGFLDEKNIFYNMFFITYLMKNIQHLRIPGMGLILPYIFGSNV
jgi:hypothetical protein